MFSFLFPQQSGALWQYLPHLLHSTLKDLLFLFVHLFFPAFNTRTLSSGSSFSFRFLPISSVFHNQHISFFGSFNCILEIFMLQDTLTCLYYSAKTSKTCDLSSSSYFPYFALILLNLRFKLYSSLNQMSGSKLVSLILQLFHLLVTSSKLSFLSSDTSYLSINYLHESCAFLSHCLTSPKGMYIKLMISKSHDLEVPSYIYTKTTH